MAEETINRIVTLIASHLKRETDEPFKRMVAIKVDQWRSTLVSRSLEKHPDQRSFFLQTIYIPMECHSLIPCDVPIPLCNVMRSISIVPLPMRFGNTLFDYVGSIDGRKAFYNSTAGTLDALQAGQYTGKNTFWEYTNKRVLIRNNRLNFNDKPIPMIRVDAVFDRPIDVFEFNCSATSDCDFWDKPYPVTGDMAQMITQYILQVDFGMKLDKDVSMPQDVEVDPTRPKNPS